MKLEIAHKQALTSDVHLLRLRDPSGADLPRFTPGAHVTVGIPNGMQHNYSLCGDPEASNAYDLAIKRLADGRGGSISLVDDTKVGDVLDVTEPNNTFKLTSVAKEFLFVAGGIGITPILSMLRHVSRRDDLRWQLIYCTRHAKDTAFVDELNGLPRQNGKLAFFHSRDAAPRAFDPWTVFEKPKKGCHVYCCGPNALMEAVKDTTGHWPVGAIHFESFGVDQPARENLAFTVRLRSTGATFVVPADRTIVEVLRAHGHSIATSCESGTCGTCRTRLLSGTADHRDMVLQDHEKSGQIIPCVSRATTDVLEIDA
jgi:phthalate 4,5-dioxygenase reductase subunit